MFSKPAQTSQPLHSLIQNRWSPRAFDPDQPVSEPALIAVLEAARWAPSCMNEQPWRFVACDRQRQAEAWSELLACLAEKNREWAQHAPVLILAAAQEHFAQNGKPNRWAAYDLGAASMSIVLQAAAEGLVAHQMGGFDPERAKQKFGLPEGFAPYAVIVIGFQADPETLSEEFKQRELAERSRADLVERVGFGAWGAGAKE